jgi:hypothetical protein
VEKTFLHEVSKSEEEEYEIVAKKAGASHFAPIPKRPMHERPKFFDERPDTSTGASNLYTRVPQMLSASAIKTLCMSAPNIIYGRPKHNQ